MVALGPKMVAQEVGVLSPAELAKVAKDEVNEEPERLAEDLQAVKDWLEKQPHLQNVRKGKPLKIENATTLTSRKSKCIFEERSPCQCSLYVMSTF